jgi:hypothetical protein
VATVNQVAIKILVDGKEMEATLGEFNQLTKEAGVSGQKSGRSIKEGFTAAKVAIVATAAAVIGIIMGLNKCVDAASNFTEANNKLLVIFKNMPEAARAARDELVNAYHMSYREAAQLLGATGDILTGLGVQQEKALDLSSATIKLAADITSFSNAEGGAVAVAHALTSAYTGEREALKTYGIVINEAMVKEALRAEGLDKLTGLALMQAKAEVTLALALEQSKNAIGDTARTANDYASVQRQVAAQMENLSMNLGSVFIPVWNKVLSGFLALLKIIGEENITGILYASWIVIREFAVRTYNLISGIVGALASLMSKNYVAATVYMMQIETALRDGWDKVFKEIEEAQKQGIIDYKAFLDGSLNAWRESNATEDEEQAVTDEERKAERLKAAAKELKLEEKKNKAELKLNQDSLAAMSSIFGSLFGKSKAAAYAQAIINTWLGVSKVIGQTGIASPFAIPSVLATGFAAAARISATKYALGGEINRPTLALAGEGGPEIAAPRKTFVDVVNQMTRSGELGGVGGSEMLDEIKGLREDISGQNIIIEIDGREIALAQQRGDQLLDEEIIQ